MLLAQEYVPDLSEYKDRFMRTPLGLLTQGNVSGAVDRLGVDAQGRVQAMSSPESALQAGMDFMGGGLLGTTKLVNKTQMELANEIASKNAETMLGLPKGNTAMDRAKAMGFDTPAYTGMNIEGEIESMLPKSWFSKEPGYASTYSEVIPADGISKDPRVYPVLLKTGKVKSEPHFGLYQDMEKALSKKNTDTFKVENVGTTTNDFYVTKNPNQVRSINAAFDPARISESDILAGMIGLPVAGLLKEPKKNK
jgi:hypothetical protein